ncbi:hypothetical protein TWF730_001619 [Orbilia blumenaviensis]|uniref:Uncharacterized protein n=1 Tax=Orbilia blumenaviensis TaxID=1796055 RepID=A0AAV9UJ43_9PEZI
MRLSTFYPFTLALLKAPLVYGWAFRLERNVEDENDMLKREWYNTKVHTGVKRCSGAGSAGGHPVTGFSITNFGPQDDGFREGAEEPKAWRDPLGWMGFWKNTKCEGLPNIIIHFYPVPYTRQAVYFPKILPFADEFGMSDLSIGHYGDIPFGSVWFHGDRLIPQGAMAVRESPSRGGGKATNEEEFQVFLDAVRVINIGPNNDKTMVDPNDHRWDGSGDLSSPPNIISLRLPGDINISANDKVDRGIQVGLGLVPSNLGRGAFLSPPPAYQHLMSGGDVDESDDDLSEEGVNGGEKIEEERIKATIPGAQTNAEVELALQQAAYRSFEEQAQSQGNVPQSIQSGSEIQGTGPGNAGVVPQSDMVIETEERYTGPPITESQKARSRINTKEILAELLQRNPNWAQLSSQERGAKWRELTNERNKQVNNAVQDLIANTPNWDQLPPAERWRLYQQLDVAPNRQRKQVEVERIQQQYRQQMDRLKEDIKAEERRQQQLREELQRQEQRRGQRRQDREARRQESYEREMGDNDKTVLKFLDYLKQQRQQNAPQPQQNSGNVGQNNPPPQPNVRGPAQNDPPSRPNAGGNAPQNNLQPQSNVGGNANQNHPQQVQPQQPRLNPIPNTNPSYPPSQQNYVGSVNPNYQQPQINFGANIGSNSGQLPPNNGANLNLNNPPRGPNGANRDPIMRPPRRWEYGSLGPGPGVPGPDYYTSPSVGTGMNSPPFYQNQGPSWFNNLNGIANQPAGGNTNINPALNMEPQLAQAVDKILNNDLSISSNLNGIPPGESNAAGKNQMEEEIDEVKLEENPFQVGNNARDWTDDPVWGLTLIEDDTGIKIEEDEFSAYQFGPRR